MESWGIFIDLDDFKPVNDTYGHEAGDRILIKAASRIRMSLRRSDIVARVGGDEFVALIQGVSGREGLINTAEKILAAFNEPFDVDGNSCHIGVSIGISLYPDNGLTSDELKNKADQAMYKVKEKGKSGYAFYSSSGE